MSLDDRVSTTIATIARAIPAAAIENVHVPEEDLVDVCHAPHTLYRLEGQVNFRVRRSFSVSGRQRTPEPRALDILQCEFMRNALLFVVPAILSLARRLPRRNPSPWSRCRRRPHPRWRISAVWSPTGDKFIYREGDTLHLMDCASGKDSELIRLSRLRSVAVKTPEPATFDWTNRRVAAEPGAVVPLRQRTAGKRGRRPFHRPRGSRERQPCLHPTHLHRRGSNRMPSFPPTANWWASAAVTISTCSGCRTAS